MALLAKSREDFVRIHAALEQLERNVFFEMLIRAARQPDVPDAAAAQQSNQLVRPDAPRPRDLAEGFGHRQFKARAHRRGSHESRLARICLEKPFHVAA